MNMIRFAVFCIATLAAAFFARPAQAQTGYGIPLAVVAEDSDPASVKRSADPMVRVISEMQSQFNRSDWNVLDEGFICGKVGCVVQDRRPREQIAGLVDLICKAGDDSLCPRAMVLMKIRAFAEPYGGAVRVRVRVSGDVFDQASNRFLDSWEAPPLVFAAPYGCAGECVLELVGDKAREIAITVGTVLRAKVDRYNRAELRPKGQGRQVVGGGSRDEQALVNSYVVEFKNFRRDDVTVMTRMIEALPGSPKLGGETGGPGFLRYNVRSTADQAKMRRWLETMLRQLDMDEDEVALIASPDRRTFILDKLR